MSFVEALAHPLTGAMNTLAVAQSATQGPGAARLSLRSLLNSTPGAIGAPLAATIDPSDHPLHKAAEAINSELQRATGKHRDSLVSQLAGGIGSSLAFLPAAAAGGNVGVAIMGFGTGFGDGYFAARERAESRGMKLSEPQLWLNGALSAGLDATAFRWREDSPGWKRRPPAPSSG